MSTAPPSHAGTQPQNRMEVDSVPNPAAGSSNNNGNRPSTDQKGKSSGKNKRPDPPDSQQPAAPTVVTAPTPGVDTPNPAKRQRNEPALAEPAGPNAGAIDDYVAGLDSLEQLLEDRGVFVPPQFETRAVIYGIEPKDYFALAGRATRTYWDQAPEPKVLAHLPGDWFRKDPTITVRTIKAVAALVTGNAELEVLPPRPDNTRLATNAIYVPTLITNITDTEKTMLLHFPLFSTQLGTIVTMPYDFVPSTFVCQLGESCLEGTLAHVGAIRTFVCDAIMKTGGGPYRTIERNFDRIAKHYTTTEQRAEYIANTTRIVPLDVNIRNDDGSQSVRTLFNVYVRSPTADHRAHQRWLDCFQRLTWYVRASSLSTVTAYVCMHCSGRTHPSGMCPYTKQVFGPNFVDTKFPDWKQSPAYLTQNSSSSKGRGGHRGSGGRRGQSSTRGRGGSRGGRR
ncbi:hypothetical protein HYPSUDRAFT_54998 [Hypholoma sublateritium FD-334 SS-4]|uniref:Uncharacterized protein n=1 Tax=Hypholoma sublateritium (strain FD-334 SS-4) TaxID=945553 RepID=A0A0D2PR29_HYPSF|nr:hypothetical protein HYPSUDRAFT_54998 [Hypholoma sublateritium FD-334 SS-4]